MLNKTIKGITIEIGGDTSGLEKSLKDVDKTTKDLQSELRGVNKLLKLDPKNTDLLRQKQVLLKKAIGETKNKLQLLKRTQAQMKAKGISENSAAYRDLQREIAATERKVKDLEAETKKLDNIKLTQLGNQMKNVGDKMKNVGRSMSMYVTAPIAAAATVGVKKFAEVDKTMQLTNATMQNTADEANMLNKAMKDAAAQSTFGMSDAATATLNFARAGLSATDAANALAPAMNLAAGEGGDLDTVSAGLIATINGFGDTFDNASSYADVFANACNNSASDVNSLSEAMSIAAPVFSAAGYEVKDAALYMGVMADGGIEASEAANALKTGLARLIDPAKAGQEWLDKLGYSVVNADGSMKDSVTIQRELHDKFMDLSESEQIAAASAIFGKNQMAKWLTLIRTSPDHVAELNSKIQEQGTTMSMAEKMMSGFGGSLEKIKSGIDVAATSFGEALAPMVAKVADVIQRLVDWFNNLSPKAQEIVAIIALIVAAIGPLLVVLGTLTFSLGSILTFLPTISAAITGIQALLGPLAYAVGAAIGSIGTALSSLWALMLANPITLVIAAIAALVAAFVILWKKSDAFRNFWKGLWAKVKEIVGAAVTWVKGAFNKLPGMMLSIATKILAIYTALPNKMMSIGKNIVLGLWNGIKGAAGWLKDKISGFVDGIVSNFKSFFGISSPSKEMADQIGKWIPAGVSEGITANLGGLQSAVDTMGNVVMDSPQLSYSGMTDEISNAIGTGLAVQNSGSGIPGVINVVVELGGAKVGEKIVNLYDYTKRATG